MSWIVCGAWHPHGNANELDSQAVHSNAKKTLTYERDVRPIFKVACFHCHAEDVAESGGLDLRLVRLMKAGGDSGPALEPGNVASSLLWERIASDEMPAGPKKLPAHEKQIIRQWIEQGAATLRPEPKNVQDAQYTYEELNHWSFQPVKRPQVPTSVNLQGHELCNAIDAFIARKLVEQRLEFSPKADRYTLIRRATFDLTGLPPTPDEVQTFVRDESPHAYARLIDRLLASPQFGVRWGRYWLDVAGYAESDGGLDGDPKRAHAWRYRDYVIAAFNHSKPVDQFLIEQLAGDELVDGPVDARNDRQRELLTATGFMRMAPDSTQTSNSLSDRNQATADSIQVISSAVLGVTVGCAQCHDHKYDPISIDDYYRFRAVFDPAFPLQNWQTPNQRLVDLTSQEVTTERKRIEAIAKTKEDDMNARRQKVGETILEKKLADVPDDLRNETRDAVLANASTITVRQKELLDQFPMVRPVSHILGLLIEYDMPTYRKFEKEQQAIAGIRATKPPLRMVMATTERSDVIPISSVFFRGNPQSPRHEVTPSELTVLNQAGRQVEIPTTTQIATRRGRRLAYAKQLTDGSHPLVGRVFVNRIWMYHMKSGLVATPSDFGLHGALPSHPELLDWLADDLMRHGWDQKRLHRLIMMSTTYQQQSRRTSQLDDVDPENRLYGRMNLRRLEAEEIRDTLYAASDDLNYRMGGASVPVTVDTEGKAVIGKEVRRDGLRAGVDDSNADLFRRSVYVEVQRKLPLNMLATFDQPVMVPNCSQRRHSTVATQSLWFLNDGAMVRRSEAMARRLFAADQTLDERINQLFLRLFARPVTDGERKSCVAFVHEQSRLLGKAQPAEDVTQKGFAALCQNAHGVESLSIH